MNAEEKIALDLVLVLLICVLIWMRWHRDRNFRHWNKDLSDRLS